MTGKDIVLVVVLHCLMEAGEEEEEEARRGRDRGRITRGLKGEEKGVFTLGLVEGEGREEEEGEQSDDNLDEER